MVAEGTASVDRAGGAGRGLIPRLGTTRFPPLPQLHQSSGCSYRSLKRLSQSFWKNGVTGEQVRVTVPFSILQPFEILKDLAENFFLLYNFFSKSHLMNKNAIYCKKYVCTKKYWIGKVFLAPNFLQ